MERCNSALGDDTVDRCLANKEEFVNEGRNNTLPRTKKNSPVGGGGLRTKDLTKKIALYDDFTNKDSRSITPLLKRTAESLINSKRKKPVATDSLSKFQSAVTNGKRGTLKVSEIGKTFENTSSSNNLSKTTNQNVSSAKKEIRTPLMERKYEMITRTSNDKPGSPWQLKHGLFIKPNSSDGVHTVDINANIVYENDVKPRVSKSTSNYENINYETVKERNIPEHLTNGDVKRDNHNNNIERSDAKYAGKVFGKCNNKSNEKHNGSNTTILPRDVKRNDIEINQYDDKNRPPRLTIPTSDNNSNFEVNHYDSEVRPARLSPANKRSNRFEYNNAKENQSTVTTQCHDNNAMSSTVEVCNNSDVERCHEKVNNSPRTRRHKNSIIESKDQLNDKSNVRCNDICNNRGSEKSESRLIGQNFKTQNCDFIKNNLKDEKPKKINNTDTVMKSNYVVNGYCSDGQVNSPQIKHKDYNNYALKSNNYSLEGYENHGYKKDPNHSTKIESNCHVTKTSPTEIKAQNNIQNEPYSSKVNYRKMRHNFDNNIELKDSADIIYKKENFSNENKERVIENKINNDTNTSNTEIYTRTRSRSHNRNFENKTVMNGTGSTDGEIYTRARSRSRDTNLENKILSNGDVSPDTETYTRPYSRSRGRSVDCKTPNNVKVSSDQEIYTRSRSRSRNSNIEDKSLTNGTNSPDTEIYTRSHSRSRGSSIDNPGPTNGTDSLGRKMYARTRSRSRDTNPENEILTNGNNLPDSGKYSRIRSRSRARSSDNETTSNGTDSSDQEIYSRARSRSRSTNLENKELSHSPGTEIYTRPHSRSRGRSVETKTQTNSTDLSEQKKYTRTRSRSRDINFENKDLINGDNSPGTEIYTRPHSRSRGRSVEIKTQTNSTDSSDQKTYTRIRSRSRDTDIENKDLINGNNSPSTEIYTRPHSRSRGRSVEIKTQTNSTDSSDQKTYTRIRSRSRDTNPENKDLTNGNNSPDTEIYTRPRSRSQNQDIENKSLTNGTNSPDTEIYTRTRSRTRRNNLCKQISTDDSSSEKSVDGKDEEVYRRNRRSPDDGHHMRRYRSIDRLSSASSSSDSASTRRIREIKLESRNGSSSATSHKTNFSNHISEPSVCTSSMESIASLKSNGSSRSESENCIDLKVSQSQNNLIHSQQCSSNLKTVGKNECKCGSVESKKESQAAAIRRKNMNPDTHCERKSLNNIDKRGRTDSSNNEQPTSPITRNISRSDPSLLCSAYYYDWNPEKSTTNNLSNENYDSLSKNQSENNDTKAVVPRRRNSSTSSSAESKRRHHSTGHSPDITVLLQHLICDIEEEEVVSSSEDETKKVDENYKLQQLEAFNRNLNELITASADDINTFGVSMSSNPIRRTFSEDDIGLKLLRLQRLKRKNNCGEIQLTRKPSVIWAIVKKMEVSLVIQRDYGDPEVIKIEDFNVRRVNTYKDVEELVVDTYMKHLQLLDKQHLDLDTYDIKYLQMADHKVPIGSSFDLSLVKIEDSFLPCRLCMKDKESWSLASLSYDSLIPKSYLEKYVSLILSHHHAIFFGPSGTGKSYLAERIANLINYRMNEGTIPPIILKNATPERWRTLLTNLSAEKRDKPFVIILDGFSQRFIESDIDIHDIIKVCEEKDPKPYIICTMTITPNTEIPAKWQLSFRWIWLSNHEEPIDGILQRYLRRKFIQYGNQHLQRESFRIADWLTAVWRHINTFLSKFTSTDCSIGPTMFYDCPSDILDAEEWFVDLWNYSITPYILHSVKQGLKQHGVRCEWEDPLTYILKSYPWVSEKVKKKMKLKRICMEDVDYSLHCHTEEEKQRLLDFLRQLEVMMFENVEPGNHPCSKGYRKESSL